MIPAKVCNTINHPEARVAVATVQPDGTLNAGYRGRLTPVGDGLRIAFSCMKAVKKNPVVFEPGQQVSFLATCPGMHFGFQIYGTFEKYITDGAMFDAQADKVGRDNLAKMGVVMVNSIKDFSSNVREDHGTEIMGV